jgi:hypothetical protein
MTPQRRNNESGNLFYIILIGIVLFAALMYMFSRSARQGTGNLTAKQAELSADGVADYAQAVGRGVERVMRNGCSEGQINFVTTENAAYPDNSDAPADKSCNVFDLNGGAITALPNAAFPKGAVARPSGGSSLEKIGTWDAGSASGHQDLVLWIGPVSEDDCTRLNKRSGFTSTPPEISAGNAQEWGNTGWGTSVMTLGTLAGHNAGCVKIKSEGQPATSVQPGYQFYYVLWAR